MSALQAIDVEPEPLSPVEEDIFRVLQEMEVPVMPWLQDGVQTLHLVMGKTVLEAGAQAPGMAPAGHG